MSINQILGDRLALNLNGFWKLGYNDQYNELGNIDNIASKAKELATGIIEKNLKQLTNEEQKKISDVALWAAHKHGKIPANHVMVQAKVVDQNGIVRWETKPENVANLVENDVQAKGWIFSGNRVIPVEYSSDPSERKDANEMKKTEEIAQLIFPFIKKVRADKYLGFCVLKEMPLQYHFYVEHTEETEQSYTNVINMILTKDLENQALVQTTFPLGCNENKSDHCTKSFFCAPDKTVRHVRHYTPHYIKNVTIQVPPLSL